jgi:hypothetical protein
MHEEEKLMGVSKCSQIENLWKSQRYGVMNEMFRLPEKRNTQVSYFFLEQIFVNFEFRGGFSDIPVVSE